MCGERGRHIPCQPRAPVATLPAAGLTPRQPAEGVTHIHTIVHSLAVSCVAAVTWKFPETERGRDSADADDINPRLLTHMNVFWHSPELERADGVREDDPRRAGAARRLLPQTQTRPVPNPSQLSHERDGVPGDSAPAMGGSVTDSLGRRGFSAACAHVAVSRVSVERAAATKGAS